MPKRKINKPYDLIQESLTKCTRDPEKRYGIEFSDISPLIEAWKSMSYRAKRKAVSDSRWNYYPLYSHSRFSPKRYGSAIYRLANHVLSSGDKEGIRALTLASEGVFAVHTIDSGSSSQRISMSKRLMKSKDPRVRTRAARILPQRFLPEMMGDKHYSVRNIAINRVGMDNCYRRYIPSDLSMGNDWGIRWLNNEAVKIADRGEIEHLIDEIKDTTEFDWYGQRILSSILKKLSREEIVFMLDKADISHDISNIIKDKITS